MAGQQTDCLRREAVLRSATAVEFAQQEIDLERPAVGFHARVGGHCFEQLLRIVQAADVFAPVASDSRVALLVEDLLPDYETSRDVHFAIRLPFDAGKQNQEVGRFSEDAPRRRGVWVRRSEGFV